MVEKIDAHHHLWSYTPEEYCWIGPELKVLQRDFLLRDFEEEMLTAGIRGSVAVQATQSLDETERLLDLAETASSIRGVVGWVPLTHESLPHILDQLQPRSKLKGVRHVIQDEPDDHFILNAEFNRGIAALSARGLVYDILIHERHLPHASVFVGRHSEQVFVLDHLAKPRVREGALEPWRKNLLLLAEHENVYCKLSGLVTEANCATWTLESLRPYLDTALEAFGPARLMAGSDWPVCLVASSYQRWWSALDEWCGLLSEDERDQVLGGTASRVYQLS